MYADSHAHLSMPAFEPDLTGVVGRARQAGVSRMMTCATSMSDAARNVAIARQHGLKASVGFHPHQAAEWGSSSAQDLIDLIASSPEIAAIGEIGLDFHYNFSPPETQLEVLRHQIRLGRQVALPLVIHCRSARDEMRATLLEERAREAGGVLHCFTEDEDFARFCLDQGFYLSFSGIVTFRRADSIRAAARLVPADRLLVETDAPYLAPEPHRGRRNEPALVTEVTRFVAGLRGETIEQTATAIADNFDRLFGRSPRGLGARG